MKDLDVMQLDCVYTAFKVPVQLAHHVSGKTLCAASLELSVGSPAGQETEVCIMRAHKQSQCEGSIDKHVLYCQFPALQH